MTYPLVCIYADDPNPPAPSTLVDCSQCGAKLWRSNGSFQHTDVEPWCYRCVAIEARKQKGMIAQVRPEERLTVVEKFMAEDGMTREQAEAMVDDLLEMLSRETGGA